MGEGLARGRARGQIHCHPVGIELGEQQRKSADRRPTNTDHGFFAAARSIAGPPMVDVLDRVGVAAAGPGHRGAKR